MENCIVCKFGGTSLSCGANFRRVRDVVRRDPRRRYIVVSAPGKRFPGDVKITDRLLAASAETGEARSRLLDPVHVVFRSIAEELNLGSVEDDLQALDAAAGKGQSAAASRGEWLCARLAARYLNLPFRDADGLFFFRDGILDESRTAEALRLLPEEGAVIPGFYGSDEAGNIVTFPRGGSDVTGALIAAALSASLYENWTDVSGFYSADPALVPESAPIPHLDYRQAELFCRLGAKVLQADCVSHAAKAGIPILVKNTFAPDEPGTLISEGGAWDGPFLVADDRGRIRAVNLPGGELTFFCEESGLPERYRDLYARYIAPSGI